MSATSSESPDSEPEPAVDLEEEAHLTEIRECELDKQIIRDEADKYKREGLDPVMMETLQILKYSLHEDLDFTEGFLATEEECAALSIDPSVVQQLSEENCVGDLISMFEDAQQYGIFGTMEAESTPEPEVSRSQIAPQASSPTV
ncbi:hypothetical protein EV122DRAFT_283563 [Schizophyllum commune]|nr:hypothetical protein K525DRAFT_274832 [Schizophyllum commune Loenen D]